MDARIHSSWRQFGVVLPPRGTFHGADQRAFSSSPQEVAGHGVAIALLLGLGVLPLRWRSHGTWRVIVHLRPNKTIVRECRGAGLGRRVRRVRRASSSSSQYASALYFIGAATGAVSCGSAQNMRTDSAKAKVSRQLATGRRRSALEPRRGIVRWWQGLRSASSRKELHSQ